MSSYWVTSNGNNGINYKCYIIGRINRNPFFVFKLENLVTLMKRPG